MTDRDSMAGRSGEQPTPERDVLISRVIDGEATPEDWAAFRAIAAQDGVIWSELAEAQQDHAELTAGIERALSVADAVEAPIDVAFSERLTVRVRHAVAAGGWVAAAAVLVIVAIGRGPGPGSSAREQTAGLPGALATTPDAALDHYLNTGRENGRVIAEMPTKVLLETRPNPDGPGFEVLYYRQILERAVVPELRTVQDEGSLLQDAF